MVRKIGVVAVLAFSAATIPSPAPAQETLGGAIGGAIIGGAIGGAATGRAGGAAVGAVIGGATPAGWLRVRGHIGRRGVMRRE